MRTTIPTNDEARITCNRVAGIVKHCYHNNHLQATLSLADIEVLLNRTKWPEKQEDSDMIKEYNEALKTLTDKGLTDAQGRGVIAILAHAGFILIKPEFHPL